MWCAHKTNPSIPIAVISLIIPRCPKVIVFPLSFITKCEISKNPDR